MHRRDWLRTASLGSLGFGFGCGRRSSGEQALHPVRVSEDRVIRTTVGLRPFRPQGFRLESETIDGKTIVHNYGHGGGGMSISWGTAHLAVEQAELAAPGTKQYAVLGAGVMGLSTARLLQQRGRAVTIYAKAVPPNTTSSMSAAWWSPGAMADPAERSEGFIDQFVRAARFANRMYQNYVGQDYGVRWIERFSVSQDPPDTQPRQGPSTRELIGDLFPQTEVLPPGTHPFPWPYVERSFTMVIEPNTYLPALLRDFRIAGGKIVARDFNDSNEISTLPETTVMNCTGLGSKSLFGDDSLTPIKGQLSVLLPQSELDYMMVGGGLYMIPRRDGVVLGGTHERGDWSLEPSATEKNRVMTGHMDFWSALSPA